MQVQQPTSKVVLIFDTPLTSVSSYVKVGRRTHPSCIGNGSASIVII